MRALLRKLILAAFAFAIALLMVEGALRVFDLAPTGGIATVTEREFSRVPGIYSPNQSMIVRQIPALPHRVSINDLGYRGESFTLAKPAGEMRIVMIGDSFVYGDYVDDENTLPVLIAGELARKCENVRVINAGVAGSSLTEQIPMARRALEVGPDVMILVVTENDLLDLAKSKTIWEQLAENRAAKSRGLLGLVYPWLRQMALWNLALEARGNMVNRQAERTLQVEVRPGEAQAKTTDTPAALVPKDYASKYREHLIALQQLAASHNIPMFMAAYPSHLSLTGSRPPDLPHWFTETGRSLGIPTTDLSAALLNAGPPILELYLLPHDGHPSPAGYAAAARVMADSLRARAPLAVPCGPPPTPS